ncbi:hypothetical protein PLEOSDRAFT_1104095 [Pleurotus ostreatus PC15]|uniref:FAD-binding PCMH-type domain-containing protein n=1 Tax=Pleurotus ostreatus (strain PC15) TaxID=1137138 RepID=A0A067NHU0_PLEO1|nr:hypothetical protein PLEOSDRAFT_1104095 [Pleurotus ostreatus PC15]
MHTELLTVLLTLVMGSFASQEHFQSFDDGVRPTAQQCCNSLEAVLVSSVILYPGSSGYTDQLGSYYSLDQATQRPACRIAPSTAEDVALIVKYATASRCEFAVRSGGHMSWEGSSNIGHNGFTIDLEGLKLMELQDGGETLSIAPGLIWGEVYAFLKPHGLHTVGARSPGVGVGGFLLGGGVSFLSTEHGLGSDNVLDYEVVLSNGSIVHANKAERSDLFWALKGGSTNYGIVTRFLIPTMPLTQLWGGFLTYSANAVPQLYERMVKVTDQLKVDPHGLMIICTAWNPATKEHTVWALALYLAPHEYPSPLFDGLQDIGPIGGTTRITDLGEILDEAGQALPKSQYSQWFTLTFKADAKLPWDVQLKGEDIFGDLESSDAHWEVLVQPMNEGMFSAGQKRGGNPFGLSVENGDQFLMLVMVFWTNPEESALMKAKTQEYLKVSMDLARERGLLTEFIYANYASGTQNVLESYGEENIKKMRAVKEKYDPNDLLEVWKGGWKL